MFTRIMAVVMAVIMLVTISVSSMGWVTLRNQRMTNRLEALTKEAREIAYLAAQNRTSAAVYILGTSPGAGQYLQWKAERVYQDYGAYIMVVDRRGRVMDNMSLTSALNPEFAASLNGKELTHAMAQVLSGEEVSLRAMVDGKPTFTVGVPFIQDERVLGAVLIQTPAQTVEGGMEALIGPILLLALTAILTAAVGVFIYMRLMLKPLTGLTRASRAMAGGDFASRVEVPEKGPAEVIELSSAFNTMADKLSEVESSRREFVANVSHELRSPITSISGFVQGMEDGTIPQNEHGKYLALVGDETRRLSKLIGDLLALSRLERDDAALEWTDFDMNEMLRRAIIRRINDLEERRMEIDCRFQQEPCMVRADSDRIEQVVVNLLDNAIKFTPDGGRITLYTELNKDVCTVTIQDNGAGILPEDRGRVFERFFTADRAHTAGKGTGLGLSICQRIMEMHGQRIWLKDTREGAAFAFTLKAAAKKA